MTNRAQSEAILPRPVPVMPVAKPRGKMAPNSNTVKNMAPNSNSSENSAKIPHYANQNLGAVPKSRNVSPGDTDTMTKTKAILNEAADAVAKSFAKQTQGINKGKTQFVKFLKIVRFLEYI